MERVTWTSEADGTSEGALFQFTGRTDPGSYTFTVAQSYSDGSVVNWAGSEDSDEPAPVVEAKDSFSSGGNSTLSIIALVVGAIGVVLGAVALLSARGRSLA